MKNMKKLLALGAVLAMGTMAMGAGASETAAQEFQIRLNVLEPLKIETDGIIDFGDIDINELAGAKASEEFEVTGAKDYKIEFTTGTGIELKNKENDSIITLNTHVSNNNGNGNEDEDTNLNGSGKYKGYLFAVLDDVSKAERGEYTGTVNLTVDYK